ncbi:transporter substrate-binding domain-containing protein [bacterium]|nr:transporter substrate-binding domain-containing protein [bacterium]
MAKPKSKVLTVLLLYIVFFSSFSTSAQEQPLSFTLDAPIYREKEAQAISRQLKRLGIKVAVKIWTKSTLREKIRTGGRVAYLTDWGSAYFDPFDLALPKFSTNGQGNFSFFSNHRVDLLLNQSMSTSSVRKRKELFHEVQQLIFKEAPWVFGYTLANIEASSVNVLNFTSSENNRINLHDVELRNGDVLVVGMNANTFYTFDPAMHRSREAETVIRNMFDALVTRNRNGAIVPELAESWVLDDDKNYLFKLRSGVKFHDESLLTVDDVVFTFQRILQSGSINGQSSPRKELLGPLESVTNVDNTHILFKLYTPFPPFLQALVHFQIVPRDYIKRVGDAEFAKKPMGTGPFKFTEGTPEKGITMERFSGYYGGAPAITPVGPAKLKTVVFKPMADPAIRISELLAGNLSIIQAVPVEKISLLAKNPNTRISSVLGTRSYQIELNNNKPPFNDIRVRKALNYAIDWQDILNKVYAGYGQRIATCFLPSGFGYNAALKPHLYDPDQARELLSKAGYRMIAETGIEKVPVDGKSPAPDLNSLAETGLNLMLESTPKKVTIALSDGSAPFHFTDSAGNPSGMFVDLWRSWSKVTGISIKFLPSSWNDTLENLRQGKADIHAGLFRSADRDSYLDFGEPLHKSDTHFFYHKSILEVDDLEDLTPFRIGIIEGDYALDFIRNRLPGATLSIYPDNRSLFDAVEVGDVKVFIKDTPIARYHLSQRKLFSEFKFHSSQPLYTNTFYAAVKEGNTKLLLTIQQGMSAIPLGEKAAIQRRWMGVSETKTEGMLSIALPENNLPFSGLDFEGKPTGLLVDVWSLWSRRTGQPIEFKTGDSDQTRYMIDKGEADIHSGIVPDKDLQNKLIFSQPFYRIASSFFYRSDIEPNSFDHIRNQEKIGVLKDSYHLEILKQKYPGSRPLIFPDHQTMIKAALSGRVQIFLFNIPETLEILDQFGATGEFVYDSKLILVNDVYAAIRKTNQKLLALVDSGLENISNEELIEIEKRWLPSPDIRQLGEKSPQIRLTLDEKQWLDTHHSIRLGVDPDWPPFEFLDEDGKNHMGMASDFIRLLNERLGLDMKVVPVSSWQEVVDKAKRKEIDVIACLTETEGRKTFLEFTKPYLSFPLVIITREDFEFVGGIKDLRDKRVAVVNQYAIHEQLLKQFPYLALSLQTSPLDGLLAVSTDKADAYVGNLMATSYLIQKHNIANLKVAAPTGFAKDFDQLKIGVRKDWPILVSILNKGLATITDKEGTEIQQKWFSVRFEHGIDVDYIRTIIIRVVLVFIVVFAIILIWNRVLKAEINRRRRAETELKKLTLAVEQSPASVLITDKDGVIEYVNSRFTDITGYSFEEIKSKTTKLFESAELSKVAKSDLWSTIRSGKRWQGDILNRKKNGETFWESVLIAPVFDRKNKITNFIAVREDITERKQAEKELLETRDAAETANRAKSTFLSNMSHEIRTPMNAILGFSQIMLRDSSVSAEQKENLRTIWRSGEHLLGLINSILEMSKIEAGRVTLNPESFDLFSLLNDIEMMLRVKTNVKGISLSVEHSEKVPRFIRTDQGKLRQILINLLGNAAKFTEEGGVVLRVDAGEKHAMLRFEIEDTGPGISESEIEKIFQHFEQTTEGRKVEGGTGLGLAISRNYAVLMNGKIKATSELGKGSLFCLEIPFEMADLKEIESKRPKQRVLCLKPGQDPVKVLVVDDQATNRKLMVNILSSVGFEVEEAANGKEAIEKFKNNKPQLILMDIVMPEMGGIEATEKIKQLPGGDKTVVFAVTASVLDDEREKIALSGAAEFIHKPFREADLFEKIKQHLDLQFEVEDREIEDNKEIPDSENLTPITREIIKQLPEKLVKHLHNAALNGYRKQLNLLIDEVGELNSNIADQLRLLVQNFDYEKLLELLK